MASYYHRDTRHRHLLISKHFQRLRLQWTMLSAREKILILSAILFLLIMVSHYAFIILSRSKLYARPLPVERTCEDVKQSAQITPKPLIILVAGGPRTGTTYLYNLVRILLRQRDPNTISGWYEDLSYASGRYSSPDPPYSPVLDGKARKNYNIWNYVLDAYRHTGTTVLVKVHSLAHATRLFTGCNGPNDIADESCPVDLVLLSHRDLCSQIASLRRMGWGNPVSRKEIVSDTAEYCRRKRDATIPSGPRVTDEEWAIGDTWVNQALSMAVCHKEWHSAVGHKLGADVLLGSNVGKRKLAEDIIAIIKRAGGDDGDDDGNNANGESIFRMNATTALVEADALRPLSCSSHLAVNPITHLHRGHVVTMRSRSQDGGTSDQLLKDEEDKKRGCAAIASDPTLNILQKEINRLIEQM